jgi:uncharacterized protein (TIGR03437 family)
MIPMKALALALLSSAALVCAAQRLPIAFERNQGQADQGIEYLARTGGYTLALSGGGAQMVARDLHVSVTFSGSRTAPAETEGKLPGVVNYLVGRDRAAWHTGIPTYSRIRYRDVYPGVDAVYYGREGGLEYDLVVAPGAQPRLIRIRYAGARGLRIDAAGDLIIEAAGGTLRQKRPVIYQEIAGLRQRVEGGYELHGDTVGFRLGAYDRTRPLVIDPALTWATYFGGGLTDQALAAAFDSSGNVYATGSTQTSRGDVDVFVTKLNPTGTSVIFTAVFGGGLGDDEAKGIVVDSTGAVYIAGATDSDDFPLVANTQNLAGLGTDAFFAKLDPTGKTLVYSNYLGGSSDDIAFAAALDSGGNLWLGGATISVDLPVSRSGVQRTYAGGIDGFVAEIDPTGKMIYTSYLGGTGDDYVFGIAVDAAGNIYTAGSTKSTDFPGTSAGFQASNGGATDAWAARLAPGAGAIQWATYLGGSGDEEATAMTIDAAGSVYLAGDTTSTNFPTANPYQGSFGGGGSDIFAAKIAGDGSKLVYATYLGGSGAEIGNSIAVDGNGAAYIAGTTNSSNFPVSFGFQSALRGSTDGVVASLSPQGNSLLFSSYIGGTADDSAEALAVSCTAGLAVVGSTASTNFPVTGGVVQTKNNGGTSDGYLALIAAGTAPTTISPGGVVNAATSAPAPVSPGSLISIYGTSLAQTTGGATSTPLPASVGGTSVNINGVAAPVIFVSPNQVNVQVPYEISTGTANATAASGCGTSGGVSFQVVPAAPYLLLGADGSALVQNQDFTFNSATNAAPKGSVVTVYLIGIGPLDTPVATGAAAPADRLVRATSQAKALIGGFDTVIQFLGLTPGFVGLAQANLVVPNLSPGKYPVVITVNGVESNAGTMYVK